MNNQTFIQLLAAAVAVSQLQPASTFSFNSQTTQLAKPISAQHWHAKENKGVLAPIPSRRSATRLYMADDGGDNDSKDSFFKRTPFFVNPPGSGVSPDSDEATDPSDSTVATVTKTTTTTTSSTGAGTAPITTDDQLSEELSKAFAEAKALKERAERERLEAERMTTLLLLDKMNTLEDQLTKCKLNHDEKKEKEIKDQIAMLKRQMEGPQESNGSKKGEGKTIDASGAPLVAPKRNTLDENEIPVSEIKMPQDLFEKRVGAYKSFSRNVKKIFASAVNVEDIDEAETIVKKCYQKEQDKKRGGNIAPMDMLDLANAQAGYETLPPPVQKMVAESVGMENETNATAVVEQMIDKQRVKRTNDGGVEFSMDDPDEDQERGKERDFTEEEVEGAVTLYENLPAAMKIMLAQSVGETKDSNSTVVVTKMIEEKKLLPAEDGVEFVVFGSGEEGLEQIETDGYIKTMIPEVTRKEGQAPSEEDVMVFFTEMLGKKTFNPRNKPEKIPGGFIIRGENTLENGDALVKALDAKLKDSSIMGKFNYHYMKDPSFVTQEQFEADDFENPVLVITGTDLSPSTNRFVKPIVTAIGGISLASFAVAVCLATDMGMDISLVEATTAPLVFSILGTQVVHELAHQIVALKDKFKAGAPTIVPSLQLGVQGCITPIKSPPPNSNSLFDFAISGPLLGMLISVLLMYSGLEKQVFMDATAQANLPSLPVDLVRSSSLGGGMVEWLLGDGTLISSDSDPSALIKLHPLAIGGFVGIVTNALNLLPIGNTDGGRIATSLFGRSFAKFVRGATLVGMVGAGFFGGDEASLLLFFAIFAQIWQKEQEIPCKNEIDGVSDERAILAFATAFLVGLAVVPLSI